MKSDMHVWIKTFFKPWPALMWLALKVILLPCSASAWEHSWPIEAGLLPWDIEMTVEEPVSDDDDGPPHRVSDSESEFESEQDSD
jgi:hypothetical protein